MNDKKYVSELAHTIENSNIPIYIYTSVTDCTDVWVNTTAWLLEILLEILSLMLVVIYTLALVGLHLLTLPYSTFRKRRK
jgi:hypothetical protein